MSTTPTDPKESVIQARLFKRIKAAEHHHPTLKLVFHIPNGGGTSGFYDAKGQWISPQGNRLKGMGVRKGIPDIFCAVPMGKWHGYFIEMKRGGGGVVSPEQRAMHIALKRQGYRVDVFDGVDDAWYELCSYLEIDPKSYLLKLPEAALEWDEVGA